MLGCSQPLTCKSFTDSLAGLMFTLVWSVGFVFPLYVFGERLGGLDRPLSEGGPEDFGNSLPYYHRFVVGVAATCAVTLATYLFWELCFLPLFTCTWRCCARDVQERRASSENINERVEWLRSLRQGKCRNIMRRALFSSMLIVFLVFSFVFSRASENVHISGRGLFHGTSTMFELLGVAEIFFIATWREWLVLFFPLAYVSFAELRKARGTARRPREHAPSLVTC